MDTLTLVNIGLIVTYVLFGVAALGAFAVAAKSLITNPKGIKMALIGLIGIAIIAVASFGLSSGSDIPEILLEKTGTSQFWVRPTGAGLIAFYILFMCTVALVIATEAMRPFKK